MAETDFDIIFKKNYKRSFLFVKSYIHDAMAAEDIAMESLYKYWRLLKEDSREISEKYLVTILKNKAISYLRHQTARKTAMDAISEIYTKDLELRLNSITSCDPEILFSSEIQKIYSETLRSLPEQTARIFEMRKNENMSIKRISGIVGISPKAVEYHMTKAMKALRISLAEYLPAIAAFWVLIKLKSNI